MSYSIIPMCVFTCCRTVENYVQKINFYSFISFEFLRWLWSTIWALLLKLSLSILMPISESFEISFSLSWSILLEVRKWNLSSLSNNLYFFFHQVAKEYNSSHIQAKIQVLVKLNFACDSNQTWTKLISTFIFNSSRNFCI